MIEARNLSFRYGAGGKPVADDISFEIKNGTVTVLLGPNGCGKTTLIKMIAGLLSPSAGEIFIDGKNSRDYSIAERSKKIAYVAQKTSNVGDYSVRDYLSFGLVNTTRFYRKPSGEYLARIDECADRLRIRCLLDKDIAEISGGERQLVAICSALVQNTEIILMDEPTSALDLSNRALILGSIKDICAIDGITVVLSSHDPNHALFLGSNVIVIKDGKIICTGASEEIVKPQTLKCIYGDDICLSKELPYDEISFAKV